MSLINDALKRASQTAPPPRPVPPPAPPPRPVENKSGSPFPFGLLLAFVFVAIVILVLAGGFIFKAVNARQKARAVTVAARDDAKESVNTIHRAAEIEKPKAVPIVEAPSKPAQTTPSTPLSPVAPATEPSKPSFPALKLQGIFFRSNNPAALINARTVFRGGTIGGVKVAAIDRESVTLEWQGQTKVLTLR